MSDRHTPQTLLQTMAGQGVCFTLHEHAPVFTVEEAMQVVDELPGAHIKNLFLKDKAGKLYLVTALHARRVDLKALGRHLGAKDRLSFAKEDVLWEHLGVRPGSVSPLGLVNAAPGSIAFVLDSGVRGEEIINPHPLDNAMTLAMRHEDMVRLIESWGHTVLWLDLADFERKDAA